MKPNYIIAFSLVIILVLGVVLFIRLDTQMITNDQAHVGGGIKGEGVSASATIRRLENGYEPKEAIIHKGETVSFVNDTADFHWPASDVHPTHSIYAAFDPREPIGPGETWSFTFDQGGVWEFHDHLRANFKGTITVLPMNSLVQ